MTIIIVIPLTTTALMSPFQLHCSPISHIKLDKKIIDKYQLIFQTSKAHLG